MKWKIAAVAARLGKLHGPDLIKKFEQAYNVKVTITDKSTLGAPIGRYP